ncbi:MAG TPA: DUF6508 domain-containing protein [Micromonosporaceae bacterium]
MSENGDPDDAALLAQLDTGPERAEAWGRLLAAADAFAARPHAEDDYRWERPEPRADGVIVLGHPVYGERVTQARRALSDVRAVTPVYHWMRHRPPKVPEGGAPLAPADAVRLATALVRGERFCDGAIGQAVERGTLQAVLASLATWYRARPHG